MFLLTATKDARYYRQFLSFDRQLSGRMTNTFFLTFHKVLLEEYLKNRFRDQVSPHVPRGYIYMARFGEMLKTKIMYPTKD